MKYIITYRVGRGRVQCFDVPGASFADAIETFIRHTGADEHDIISIAITTKRG